jgi:hypothetical protein
MGHVRGDIPPELGALDVRRPEVEAEVDPGVDRVLHDPALSRLYVRVVIVIGLVSEMRTLFVPKNSRAACVVAPVKQL